MVGTDGKHLGGGGKEQRKSPDIAFKDVPYDLPSPLTLSLIPKRLYHLPNGDTGWESGP